VLIFDLAQKPRKLILDLATPNDAVFSLAWSPDGALLASGHFRAVRLWDLKSSQPTRTITTDLAGLPEGAVPWVLATVGLGMTIGNLVGGRVADWSVMKALFGFALLMLLSLAGFALTGQWPVTLFLFTFAIGFATQGLGPTIQTRLMDVAGDSQAIAAGLIHSALNVGNALGAYFGGVAIAAGLGYSSPAVVGMGLTVVGIAVAATGYLLERRGVIGPTR
jgi:DHA1 family inner membrane transport protein